MFLSSMKSINKYVKHLLLRKNRSQNFDFMERKFEDQKGTRHIRGNVYSGIIVFSCISSTKPYFKFLLIYFDR